MEETDIVCLCNNVKYGAIRRAVYSGMTGLEEVRRATGCGRGCAMCLYNVERYIAQLRSDSCFCADRDDCTGQDAQNTTGKLGKI